MNVNLTKGVVAKWNASDLNELFSDYWVTDNPEDFPVLHDQEATPAQPMPYCIFEQETSNTTARMTGHSVSEKHEIRQIPCRFTVHARKIGGVSGKKIATSLIREITKVFGGHPTVAGSVPTIDNGKVLLTQYQTDFGTRTGEEEYSWVVRYLFLVDVPTMVASI